MKSCTLCRYFEWKSFKKLPSAPLPNFRVQYSYPFKYTGVDYLGPLFIQHTLGEDKAELFKVHVVLYTRASSRAVHLDIVPDISSEALVRSLKRFISRCGIPKFFISDNAKCFIGKELKCYLNLIHTDWEYILERSPRLVQTVKRSLRKVLTKSKVTYKELLTVVIETL